MNSAGIYISIPFCQQKCTYCNFASGAYPASLLPRYVESLVQEITRHADLCANSGISSPTGTPVDTIYFGGGTPGLLDAAQLEALVSAVRKTFSVADGPEITLEASPENVTPARAAAWSAVGVNRISLGVQSMMREELRAVGRMHEAHTVSQAFSTLRSADIHNISADLIAGLPRQTADSWQASLNALLELAPAHFSVYMLEVDSDSRLGSEILHDGSRYHAGEVPSDEQIVDFYCAAMDRLRAAGYEHYEISNFALPGKASRHNRKYWNHAPYFGFGTDAHSFDGERRWANTDSLDQYLELIGNGEPPIVDVKTLCEREKLEERLFLGLRCREGVSISRLNEEFSPVGPDVGLDVEQRFAAPIREFCEAGWLESAGGRLRLTDRGVLFSNEVFQGFLEGN